MHSRLAAMGQVAVMAAIVATVLFVPLCLALALLLRLLGVSLEQVATFGGALDLFAGLFAWWLMAFAGACCYAAFAFPWGDKVLAWPRKD